MLVGYLNKMGKAESSLYGIDPYGGRKATSHEDRMLAEMTEKVERRLKQNGTISSFPQQQQPQQHQGQKQQQKPGDRASSSQQGRSKEDKLRELCQDFNSSGGCGQANGQCNKGKHLCSNSNAKNYICMRKHSAVSCRNPQMNK